MTTGHLNLFLTDTPDHALSPASESLLCEVPVKLDVLPDGREALVYGDVSGEKALLHKQGENSLGFKEDCGLVSCEEILRSFGRDVNEDAVVIHAVVFGECAVLGEPELSGGTSPESQARVLTDLGLPARVEVDKSLESLAEKVEGGYGTIICLNAGLLWNDATYFGNGAANHAVVVTGVARDERTGGVLGFYVNDSGTGDAGRFVSADLMEKAYIKSGGGCVVTQDQRPSAAPQNIPTV